MLKRSSGPILTTLLALSLALCAQAEETPADEQASTEAPSAAMAPTPAPRDAPRVLPSPKQSLEMDIADILRSSDTQVLELSAMEKPFNGYFLPSATGEALGGALIFPGDNYHGAWPVTLDPLRRALTRLELQTLVVPLPAAALPAIPKRTLPSLSLLAEQTTTEEATETEAPAEGESAPAPTPAPAEPSTAETAESSEEIIERDPLLDIVLARAQVANQTLVENSPALLIIGIEEGASWAAAYTAQLPASAAQNSKLLLITPKQSMDPSAPDLVQSLGASKIEILDIYSANAEKRFSAASSNSEQRQRAAKRAGVNYQQFRTPRTSQNRHGNDWLVKKVYGVAKTRFSDPLKEAAEGQMEAAMEPKAAATNQPPGG